MALDVTRVLDISCLEDGTERREKGLYVIHKHMFRIHREGLLHVRRCGGRKREIGLPGQDAAAEAEPALVAGFRILTNEGPFPVPDHDHGSRLHP